MPDNQDVSISCPRDTNGDGDCGDRWCPVCGEGRKTPVHGVCPACGEQCLDLIDGHVLCRWPTCPRPRAVQELLGETLKPNQHIITYSPERWSATHPLIERASEKLHSCDVWNRIEAAITTRPFGTYIVSETEDEISIEPVPA